MRQLLDELKKRHMKEPLTFDVYYDTASDTASDFVMVQVPMTPEVSRLYKKIYVAATMEDHETAIIAFLTEAVGLSIEPCLSCTYSLMSWAKTVAKKACTRAYYARLIELGNPPNPQADSDGHMRRPIDWDAMRRYETASKAADKYARDVENEVFIQLRGWTSG